GVGENVDEYVYDQNLEHGETLLALCALAEIMKHCGWSLLKGSFGPVDFLARSSVPFPPPTVATRRAPSRSSVALRLTLAGDLPLTPRVSGTTDIGIRSELLNPSLWVFWTTCLPSATARAAA